MKSIDGSNDYPLVISNSPPGSMHSNSSLKNELQTQVNNNTYFLYLFFGLDSTNVVYKLNDKYISVINIKYMIL